MPDQDTPVAGSPPCGCDYCFYPAFVQPIAARVASINPETLRWVIDLDPPADTPAGVEGP